MSRFPIGRVAMFRSIWCRLLLVTMALLIGLAWPLVDACCADTVTIVRATKPQRGVELLDGLGRPWLTGACCAVQLAEDITLRSNDPRYQLATRTQDNRTTLRLTDIHKQLDQTWIITALDDRCFTFVLTVTNTSDKPLTLKQICPLEGTFVEKHDPSKRHILLNGTSMSGPRPTALRPKAKKLESWDTIALESPALAAGFLTGKYNFNHFTVTEPDENPAFRAFGDCDGCRLLPGTSRQTDTLFVSLHDNPLEQLERYADLAGKINQARIWPPRVAWCSWYAGWMRKKMATYKNGLEKGVEENIGYVNKYFASRGGRTMRICDDFNMYGDWLNHTQAIPGGFDRLARRITDAGLTAGVWYAPYWASTESEVFKTHREWFAQNDDGSIYLVKDWQPGSRGAPAFAIFDTSRADVQQYFEHLARTWRERGFEYVTTDFLAYAHRPAKFYDPTMTKAEVLRHGLEAIRRGLGKDVFYRTIGAPIGVCMGLTDDLRISGDSHGDNPSAYFRTAQVWFCHRRLWLNDPSAVVCVRYGELKPIEWNRMWMSWIALSGTVMTYGEVLDELPEQYIAMYQRLFPSLPVAGRPLDLWENAPYMLWGMNPGEADGPYVLFGVFDVKGNGSRQVRLNLDEVAARCRGWDKPKTVPHDYLLWDFWQQKLVRSQCERLELPVAAKSCHLFALRPKLGRPQLLGTSGHFSQGAIETSDIVWNAEKGQLRGNVQGNGGEPSTLFFHVPEAMQLSRATLNGTVVNTRQPEASVLAVEIPSLAKPVPLVLSFLGSPGETKPRPFVPGHVAVVSSEQ